MRGDAQAALRAARGARVAVRLCAETGSVPGRSVREGGLVGADPDRERPDACAPARVRSSDARRRPRRGRLDRGRGRPSVPGCDERRLDGRHARARPARHRRRGPGAGGDARVRAQRAPHRTPRRSGSRRSWSTVAPEGFTRARFTVSGADANEMAIQIARSYHVERGEHDRWQVISPAQAYHGPTMETLALTGRPGMHGPFGPYLPQAPAHPAEHLAVRPVRRGGARRARRARSRKRVPGTSPRSSASRSAAPPSRATPRPRASGKALPSGAIATASSCASTRS